MSFAKRFSSVFMRHPCFFDLYHCRPRRRGREKDRRHRSRPAAAMAPAAPGDESRYAVQGDAVAAHRAVRRRRPLRRRRRPQGQPAGDVRRHRHGRRLEDRKRRGQLDAPDRRTADALDRRHRRLRVRSGHRLARNGRSQSFPGLHRRHRGLQVDRRRQNLAAHGPGRDADDRPDPHPPGQSRYRLCRRHRPRVDRQSRPRRVQDDRRRQDLAEGFLHQRKGRGHRPGHGPDEARYPDRLDGQPHPPALERPAPGRRGRPVQDDRRRQDLEGADQRPSRHEDDRPDRPRSSAAPSPTSSMPSSTITPRPGCPSRASATPTAGCGPIPTSSAPRSIGPTTRAKPGGRSARPTGCSSASAGPTAGSSARSASIPTTPTSSISWASASTAPSTAARPGRSLPRTSTATTTACGSIPSDSNYLINVNDGGAYVSYDFGKNWRSFQNGIPATQFYNVAYDMKKPFNVYGSVQDFGTFRGLGVAPLPPHRLPEDEWRSPGWSAGRCAGRGRVSDRRRSHRPEHRVRLELLRAGRAVRIQGRRMDEQGDLSQGRARGASLPRPVAGRPGPVAAQSPDRLCRIPVSLPLPEQGRILGKDQSGPELQQPAVGGEASLCHPLPDHHGHRRIAVQVRRDLCRDRRRPGARDQRRRRDLDRDHGRPALQQACLVHGRLDSTTRPRSISP